MHDRSLRARLAFAATLLLGAGCSRSEPGPAPGQVRGRLTLEGRELVGVVLTFWPEGTAGRPWTTVTSGGGHFSLRCPAGRYKVTVTPLTGDGAHGSAGGPLPMAGRKRSGGGPAIPAFYQQAKTTPFAATIPEEGTDSVILDVVSGKGGR
jgi:hypothetical protein